MDGIPQVEGHGRAGSLRPVIRQGITIGVAAARAVQRHPVSFIHRLVRPGVRLRSLVLALACAIGMDDGSNLLIFEGTPDEQLHLVDTTVQVESTVVRKPATTELER